MKLLKVWTLLGFLIKCFPKSPWSSATKTPSTDPQLFIIPLRLENWRFEEWGDQVTVVSCDMRDWAAPEKADIIVSELLGSFGDNELSPECLDGAQHFLKGTAPAAVLV